VTITFSGRTLLHGVKLVSQSVSQFIQNHTHLNTTERFTNSFLEATTFCGYCWVLVCLMKHELHLNMQVAFLRMRLRSCQLIQLLASAQFYRYLRVMFIIPCLVESPLDTVLNM